MIYIYTHTNVSYQAPPGLVPGDVDHHLLGRRGLHHRLRGCQAPAPGVDVGIPGSSINPRLLRLTVELLHDLI